MDVVAEICRACLNRADRFSHFICQDISPKQYSFCTSIEVNYEDELPKAICDNCFNQINKFVQFKSRCIKSEMCLLNLSDDSIEDKVYPPEEVVVDIVDTTEDLTARGDIKCKKEQSITETWSKLKTEDADAGGGAVSKDSQYNQNEVTDLETDILQDIKEEVEHIETTRVSLVKSEKSNKKSVIEPRHKPYNCDQCNKRYLYEKQLENHRRHQHNIETKTTSLECKKCNKTCVSMCSLRIHIKQNHTQYALKDVSCQICSKVCKTPGTLRIHQKTHEHRQEHVCEECGKVLKSPATFKNHLETHIKNRERTFPCKHCGKNYMNKKTCAKHVARRHTNKQFICNYCSYVFTDKLCLARHIMLHEGTHPKYKCDICSRSLTSKASLLVHKRQHTGEKPYSCTYCPKSFSDRAWLVEHERNHTGAKPFECVVCLLRFSRRGSMKRHMKVHNMWKGCKQKRGGVGVVKNAYLQVN